MHRSNPRIVPLFRMNSVCLMGASVCSLIQRLCTGLVCSDTSNFDAQFTQQPINGSVAVSTHESAHSANATKQSGHLDVDESMFADFSFVPTSNCGLGVHDDFH